MPILPIISERCRAYSCENDNAIGFIFDHQPRMRSGLWVVTPTGQDVLLHLSAWMQPIESMKARAAPQKSAPKAMRLTITNPVEIYYIRWNFDLVSNRKADKGIVNKDDRLLWGTPNMEAIQGSSSRTAFPPIDGDEIGVNAGFYDGFANC